MVGGNKKNNFKKNKKMEKEQFDKIVRETLVELNNEFEPQQESHEMSSSSRKLLFMWAWIRDTKNPGYPESAMEISRCEVTDGTVEYNTDFKLYKNNKEFEMNKQFKCVTKENDTNPEKTLKDIIRNAYYQLKETIVLSTWENAGSTTAPNGEELENLQIIGTGDKTIDLEKAKERLAEQGWDKDQIFVRAWRKVAL